MQPIKATFDSLFSDRYHLLDIPEGLDCIEQHFFQCGPGWYRLLASLLETIDHYISVEARDLNFKITSIRESFASLQIGFYGADAFITGAIRLAEKVSFHTCEVCGLPGEICGSQCHYIKSLCPNHAKEQGLRPLSNAFHDKVGMK